MEVKGATIKTLPLFIRERYGDEAQKEWRSRLSPKSRELCDLALASSWYPAEEGIIEPTQKFCDLFFDGDIAGAWECGRYSADRNLKGIYRIMLKIGSGTWVAERSSRIFQLNYRPGKAEIIWSENRKGGIVRFVNLDNSHETIEYRIGGFMEQAQIISGSMDVKFELIKSISRGDDCTEFRSSWS